MSAHGRGGAGCRGCVHVVWKAVEGQGMCVYVVLAGVGEAVCICVAGARGGRLTNSEGVYVPRTAEASLEESLRRHVSAARRHAQEGEMMLTSFMRPLDTTIVQHYMSQHVPLHLAMDINMFWALHSAPQRSQAR